MQKDALLVCGMFVLFMQWSLGSQSTDFHTHLLVSYKAALFGRQGQIHVLTCMVPCDGAICLLRFVFIWWNTELFLPKHRLRRAGRMTKTNVDHHGCTLLDVGRRIPTPSKVATSAKSAGAGAGGCRWIGQRAVGFWLHACRPNYFVLSRHFLKNWADWEYYLRVK